MIISIVLAMGILTSSEEWLKDPAIYKVVPAAVSVHNLCGGTIIIGAMVDREQLFELPGTSLAAWIDSRVLSVVERMCRESYSRPLSGFCYKMIGEQRKKCPK